MEFPGRKKFQEFALFHQEAKGLSYAWQSYQAGRSTNSISILLLGLSGAGKSHTINNLFAKTITEIGDGSSVTKEILEFILPMPSEEAGISNMTIHVIDTPGFGDTQGGLEYDARVVANVKQFFKKEGSIPNFVLLALKFTDNRLEGDFSPFVKLLQTMKMKLVGPVVDKDHPNLVVVLTHFCGAVKKVQRDPSAKVQLVQQLILANLGIADCPVVVAENCGEDCELPQESGYYILPNNEHFPYNIFQSMKNLAKGSDPLGQCVVNEAFRRLGQTEAVPEKKIHRIMDTPESEDLVCEIMRLQVSNTTEIGDRLQNTWSQLDSTERNNCRLKPPELAQRLALYGYRSESDLPKTSEATMELFRSLAPDAGILTLLRTSLGLEAPHFTVDLLAGRAYDITKDQTTPFNVVSTGSSAFSPVGCYFPDNLAATLVHEVSFICEKVRSSQEFVQQRLRQLGISISAPKAAFNYSYRSGYNYNSSQSSGKLTAVYERRLMKLQCKREAVPSEELKQAVKALPSAYDKSDAGNVQQWEQFFKSYGTHYVRTAYVGGTVVFEISNVSYSSSASSFSEHSVGLSGFLKGVMGSAEFKSSDSSDSRSASVRDNLTIDVIGGNGSAATAMAASQNYEEFLDRLAKWEKTLLQNPMVSDLSVTLGEVADVISRVEPRVVDGMKKAMMDLYEAQLKYEPPPPPPPPREEVPQTLPKEGGCFTGDTLICTPHGPTPISQIVRGQLVLNKNGHSVKVIASVKTYAGDTVELYGFAGTALGHKPFFTAAHPFMSVTGKMLVVDKFLLCESNPQLKYTGNVEQMPSSGNIKLMAFQDNACQPVAVPHLTSKTAKEEPLYFLVVEGDGSHIANGFISFIETPDFNSWPMAFAVIAATVSMFNTIGEGKGEFNFGCYNKLKKLTVNIKQGWQYLVNNKTETSVACGEKYGSSNGGEDNKQLVLEEVLRNNSGTNLALMLYSECGEMLYRHLDEQGLDLAPFIDSAKACMAGFQ